jgi:hypothetical protein
VALLVPQVECGRERNSRRLIALVVLCFAVVAAGCSSDVSSPGWPAPNAGTTIASVTLIGRVVSVSFMPYPEGSGVARFLTTPTGGSASPYINWTAGFEAFAAKLGWPLPEPLPQPRACKRGQNNYTVLVMLDSGQQQAFGPCTRPPLVDQATALLSVGFP